MKKRPHAEAQRRRVAIRILFFPSFLRLCVSASLREVFLKFVICYLLFVICATAFGQVASRTDGVNVFYYDSLFEAVAVANGVSVEQPDEIILLADLVLDEPLLVDDGVHIRLVAGASDRTIRRSGKLIDYPVIWVNGDSSSLTLGRLGMEHELVIDGGRLNSPPIDAHAPLIAVSGPDSKLIMYDKVTIQNNNNIGSGMTTNYYKNGTGVLIRTRGDINDRYAEFIMKGGTIRGNINNTQNPIPSGGGVLVLSFGIFTMEGGVIMNNTAQFSGGGVQIYSEGSFKKTGGIIYGSNAPAGYRNTAIEGLGTPRCYGHAVAESAVVQLLVKYRDDTVSENDNLTYIGSALANGTFGRGEKWDNPDKALLRMLSAILLPFLALVVSVFLILRKKYLQKLTKIIQEAADTTPEIDLENMGLSDREKDVCELLLTDRSLKEIALILELSYSGANFHAQKLYAKLGIQNRTELLIRMRREQ
jgi:DNA-binding CsgD family transcriptional regulator